MNVFDFRQLQRPNRDFLGILTCTARWFFALIFAILMALGGRTVHAAPSAVSTGEHTGAFFGPAINIAVDAEGAHCVKTADLDGDGDLDVITASRTDGNLRWYRNEGAAGFVVAVIDVIDGIYIATPGDIDADGDVDIFIASVSEVRPQLLAAQIDSPATDVLGTVLWYENDGQAVPSFERHVIYGALNYPVSLHAADLDGDGDLDAMSASRDDNRILWYENNGDRINPIFFPRTITESALGAVSVHAADFDGDGDLDVVSASENDDQIAWYENQGQRPPQFTTHIIRYTDLPLPLKLDYAKSVFGVDVDKDGDQDIVFGSEHHDQVGWYENDGAETPTFVPHIVASDVLHVKFVGAVDLDLDGDIDLLSASTGDHTVAWYENDGNSDPNFVRHIVSAGALGARYVHAADLDGDGDLDLLSASRDDNRIVWYPNRTIHRNAVFPEEAGFVLAQNADTRIARAGDLDGDGDLDAVSIGRTSIEWYENSGAVPPTFAGRTVAAGLNDGRWITVADLDSDGNRDLVYAASGGLIGWQQNDGRQPPAFTNYSIAAGNGAGADDVKMVSAADLDSDGDVDLYAATGDRRVAWYENLGTTPSQFREWTVTQEAMGIRFVEAADLNGDGRLDLVSASFDDDSIRWYENLGGWPPTFREQLISSNVDGAHRVHAVDLDSDGDVDLIAAAELGRALIWYDNLGGFLPSFVQRRVDGINARSLAVADLDQDGDMDIVAGLDEEFAATWYESDGQSPPIFTRHSGGKAGFGSRISLADLDGDADADLLAVNIDDGRLTWLENSGGQYGIAASQDPSTWIKPDVPKQLLAVNLTHRGQPGDSNIELASLNVQFADLDGRAMTTAQIQQHLTSLSVYAANCCVEQLNPDVHPLLATVSPLVLDANGRLPIRLPMGEPNVSVAAGGQATYFLVGQSMDGCADDLISLQIQLVISGDTARDQVSGVPVWAEGFRPGGLLTPVRVGDGPSVVINEVATEGSSQFAAADGIVEQSGWFELFNRDYVDVDLSGMYLTTALGEATLYRIPAGVQIPARGYLLFIADGNSAAGPTHTTFRLSDADEVVALFPAELQEIPVDALMLDQRVPTGQLSGASWGRYPDGSTNLQTLVSTPGAPNQANAGPYKMFFAAIFGGNSCPTR